MGKEVDKTTIYRLLKRQEWGKRMPRPSHPEADPEAQEAFKKLSLTRATSLTNQIQL